MLLALVIFVWKNLQRRRRYCGHERLFDAEAAERGLQVFDVVLDDSLPGIFQRRGASEPVHPRAAGRALHPLGNDSALAGACLLGVELGELFAFFAAERPSGTALLRR